MYSVKELFYSLQGEGAHAGRAAVFCRFTGCNLWSGREQDRAKAACNFCDTDFVGTDGEGGGKYGRATDLAKAAMALWPASQRDSAYLICTGGEPLLQLDQELVSAFKAVGFEVAIETNGTLPAPTDIDWICVSPKGSSELVLQQGDELKLVYRQQDALPERFENLDFSYFFLQAMAGPQEKEQLQQCVKYCQEHPQWRLSLQTHKLIGIP
ncbi:7-carboxy-7-deazaguanine synthase [Motiliproteus sp. MSK22-1]|uniref:7-carboxy-7-deazaguanine synthase n=1 Tax=Motiliproteus sp. MSK22-1 TaxID=1897630 RepID=UPI000976A664|nr:7-carboxy-7-deazaguanine synthase [Motiliproteus sp. MSK22-1]OMH38797.1 7-carboxy-7-deazaguanine synthase [Motiliproteus sp. MSK22-1]